MPPWAAAVACALLAAGCLSPRRSDDQMQVGFKLGADAVNAAFVAGSDATDVVTADEDLAEQDAEPGEDVDVLEPDAVEFEDAEPVADAAVDVGDDAVEDTAPDAKDANLDAAGDAAPDVATVDVAPTKDTGPDVPTCNPAQCNDANPCTTDSCSSGKCAYSFLANGSTCDDGNPGTNGEVCAAGQCKAKVCQPGASICMNGQPAKCESNGTKWTSTGACATGQTCLGPGSCKAIVCSPGKSYCVGSALWQCDATGAAPTLSKDCANSGQLCVAEACVDKPKVCSPASKKCLNSQTIQVCDAAGATLTVASCDDGNACTQDGCSQDQCTTASAQDGTSCLVAGVGGCGISSCAAGTCSATALGLWQKTLAGLGGSPNPGIARVLSNGHVQWMGIWAAAGSTTPATWIGRSDFAGKMAASWPFSDPPPNRLNWYVDGLDTWYALTGKLVHVDGAGLVAGTIQMPTPVGMSAFFPSGLGRHPNGDFVMLGTGGVGQGLFVLKASAKAAVHSIMGCMPKDAPILYWNADLQQYVTLSVCTPANSGGVVVWPTYVHRFDVSGKELFGKQVAALSWSAMEDPIGSQLPGGDMIVAGRLLGLQGQPNGIGAARITPTGDVVWQKQFAPSGGNNPQQVGGLWGEGKDVVLVSTTGGSELAWFWARGSLENGTTWYAKTWSLGAASGLVPVTAAPSGFGAVVALVSEYKATPSLYRVDAWGNPNCASSGGCANMPASAGGPGQGCSQGMCK